MQYKLVIFDWDGTLLDSAGHIISCFQQAARDLNLPQLSAPAIRNIIGLGLIESCAALVPHLDHAGIIELVERYRHYYFLETEAQPSSLFPRVEETLQRMHDHGYLLAIATGKSRRGLNRNLRELNLQHLFHATRCADESKSKPDPKMIQEILAELKIAPQNAVMIGDTEYDMEMAMRAGIVRIGVTYGAHPVERLIQWRPLACIDALDELCALLASFEESDPEEFNNS